MVPLERRATIPPVCPVLRRKHLADLHVHLYGCIRAIEMLGFLAATDKVDWDWYETEFEAAFGFVPPTRELVERYRAGDGSVVDAFSELFVVGEADAGSFARFAAKANLKWSAVNDSPERLAAQVLGFATTVRADFRHQGVDHVELRTFCLPEVLEAFLHESGPPVQRVVATLPRGDPWAAWEQVKREAAGPFGEALVAVDWSGVEEGHPPRELAEVFAEVRGFNVAHPDRALAILAHVGESFADKSLESAIRWVHEVAALGAHRLGHAIALGVDPALYGPHARTESVAERKDQIAYDLAHAQGLRSAGVRVERRELLTELDHLASAPAEALLPIAYDQKRLQEIRRRQNYAMEQVRKAGAVIEVCPTSNGIIGGISDPSFHPVHRFIEAGLRVVISTDNPGTFVTTLGEELAWVCRHTGGGDDLRLALLDNAWNSRAEVLSGRHPNAS